MIAWFLAFHATDSTAQTLNPKIGSEAIQIAQEIEEKNLIATKSWIENTLSEEKVDADLRLSLLRQSFMESIAIVSQEELENIAVRYNAYAQSSGTKRDREIGLLFSAYSRNVKFGSTEILDLSGDLSVFLTSPDWFVRHRAMTLIVSTMKDSENADTALQTAQEALMLVPKENSIYSIEAQITSLEDIAFLHNYLRNPEQAIVNTRSLISLQLENGFRVNGFGLINNLIYSFSKWRDFETAEILAEILLRIEKKSGAGTPGLTESRISKIKNNLGDYQSGLKYADLALADAEQEFVSKPAQLYRIVSLAGMGKTEVAEDALNGFIDENSIEYLEKTYVKDAILHARFVIAATKNNLAHMEEINQERLKLHSQSILMVANQQTNSKLAQLQNTKDRQAEREAALQRESELQKEALDKQAQSNRLLTVLLAVLSAAAIAALAFARFRSKVAKKLKISAEQAEAGEKSKSEFLALMSHELRTPLNGIIGLADFLADQAPTPDLREKNAVILNSGHELLSLVENILDMTLIEAGEMKSFPEPTVLRPLLEECISNWKQSIERKGIAYTAHIDPSVPDIMTVDPKRLMQCINNLLSNAAKFTSKGRVHVHILGKDLKDNQAELQVIVADTGVGITEAAQGRMFQAFVQADTSMTRHYGGAGLGLAITKNLAQYMGGDVTVTSKNGRGSEFILTVRGETDTLVESATPEIPSLSGAVPVPVIAPAPEAPRRVPRRILAVDDDVSSHDVLRTLLEPSDCKLVCVPNGQFALEALKENLFDLILMDIRMPAMNGIEATRSIRNSGKPYADIPIVAVTADVAPETQEMCLAAGVDEFVAKPVSIKALLEAFDRLDPDRVDIREAS